MHNAIAAFLQGQNDRIIYMGPDHELKIGIGSVLGPELFRPPSDEAARRYLSSVFLSRRGYRANHVIPTLSKAQQIVDGIREKFNVVPIDEMATESSRNTDLSILSTIIYNELRLEAPEINTAARERLVSEHHRASHDIKYAADIALEYAGVDMSGDVR
ncbi:MAG TPA: hypothetical protein VL989_03345 [Candidatus Sulfotelmatobacter sp.]|nr:hypothetical protein [Candidatus Sulfotelmatobacter sp.]